MQALYHYFHSNWLFNRQIMDHRNNQILQAKGEVKFMPQDAQTLLYHEMGQFQHNDMSDFYRSYRYCFAEKGISIFFADGASKDQLFQFLHFSTDRQQLIPDAQHVCGDDIYDGSYMLTDQNSFSIRYNIKGLRKDYTMTTDYTRNK